MLLLNRVFQSVLNSDSAGFVGMFGVQNKYMLQVLFTCANLDGFGG